MNIANRIADVAWSAYMNQQHHGGAWTSNGPPEWVRKFAAVVVEELGLRQEWAAFHKSGGALIRRTQAKAQEDFDNFVERPPGVEDPGSGVLTHIAYRYVTEWVPE